MVCCKSAKVGFVWVLKMEVLVAEKKVGYDSIAKEKPP